MSSFTTNMHNHITLQTQRTTIYLAVKESYTYKFPRHGRKIQLLYVSLECTILQKKYEYPQYQVHFHICHSVEHRWDQQGQPERVY